MAGAQYARSGRLPPTKVGELGLEGAEAAREARGGDGVDGPGHRRKEAEDVPGEALAAGRVAAREEEGDAAVGHERADRREGRPPFRSEEDDEEGRKERRRGVEERRREAARHRDAPREEHLVEADAGQGEEKREAPLAAGRKGRLAAPRGLREQEARGEDEAPAGVGEGVHLAEGDLHRGVVHAPDGDREESEPDREGAAGRSRRHAPLSRRLLYSAGVRGAGRIRRSGPPRGPEHDARS